MSKGKSCAGPETQKCKRKVATEGTLIKPNRYLNEVSLSVSSLHMKLGERSDFHGGGGEKRGRFSNCQRRIGM